VSLFEVFTLYVRADMSRFISDGILE